MTPLPLILAPATTAAAPAAAPAMANAPMLVGYSAVVIFFGFALAFIGVTLLLARIFRPRKDSYEKSIAYECGEEPTGNAWMKFNIRFYVLALIFIVFDVEAALLVPWAVVYKSYPDPVLAFLEGLVFLLVLGAGLAYVWAKGDLEWIKPQDRHDNLEIQAWQAQQAEKQRLAGQAMTAPPGGVMKGAA